MSAPTFGEVIIHAFGDTLTTDVKGKLQEAWGELPATEIGAKNVFAIITEFLVILPNPDYSDEARLNIAEALLAFLTRIGMVPVAPQQPLKVELDKTPAQMSLRELLEALAADASRYMELRPFILETREIREAVCKQGVKDAWVIMPRGAKTGIDITTTMTYVGKLQRKHATASSEVDGRRPVTLEKAFGKDERALVHPLTGQPVYDLPFGAELHEALLWAKATGHKNWHSGMDLFTFNEETAATPLGKRWQQILEDYRYAKENDDEAVRTISRFWPEDAATSQRSGLLGSVMDSIRNLDLGGGAESNDERLVREIAALKGFSSSRGHSSRITGVYERLVHRGSSNNFDVVCVDGAEVHGHSNAGRFLLPPRVSVEIYGNSNNIRQQNVTWRWLLTYLNAR